MRKYNNNLFWTGVLMNIFANVIFFVAVVLCIAGIWNKNSLYIGLVLLVVDVIAAFIKQLRIKNTVETSTNPNFEKWAEIMSKDNWREEMGNAVDNKIKERQEKEDTDDCEQ
ncbi:MAG: hypothetical protein IJ017_06910 [Oscillospiraceae bacterium]|nr:hypothetical protein [Oscillospiraceae bacterium]